MNREELEKMFDKKFRIKEGKFNFVCGKIDLPDEVKQFIFDTIIPEVLKSVLGNESQSFSINNGPLLKDRNGDTVFFGRDMIRKKAKELYNITL